MVNIDSTLEILHDMVPNNTVFLIEIDGERQLLDFRVGILKVLYKLIVLVLKFRFFPVKIAYDKCRNV